MALSVTAGGSYSTTIEESSTGNKWKIITMTNNETNKTRVTGVSISFTPNTSGGGTVNCTETAMKALHDAVVTAFQAHIGSNKGTW